MKTDTEEAERAIEALVEIGQSHVLEAGSAERLPDLIDVLLTVEQFYAPLGGIVGYHNLMVSHLQKGEETASKKNYLPPEGWNISNEDAKVRRAYVEGIRSLPLLAEMYPVGGAADRLRLIDETTKEPLPAAKLQFFGKSLLQWLIDDVTAREYLYYKLFGERITVPIAMMTSQEKNNHAHIVKMCEENNWFSRPKTSFRLFVQPLVPAMDKTGKWCLIGPMQMLLKPGGHGVIWKVASDDGVFDWFYSQGKKKAIVRQINNPIAGVDYGLLAFAGLGCLEERQFGFASCPRQVKASEGMNILVEQEREGYFDYTLTNVEYCDFKKYQIPDEPAEVGSHYSKFPSNTNILFVDLQAVQEAIKILPLPGCLVNLKKITYQTESGEKEEEVARLESTMQNMADAFVDRASEPLAEGERFHQKSFVTFNKRHKTISAIKREFALGTSLLETPEGCFLDLCKNGRELLVERCGMEIGAGETMFIYHPILGPLYSIIAQKIRGGKMANGSELQLEIAELELQELDLDGSLMIRADSLEQGKCVLRRVAVRNRGIAKSGRHVYWKNQIERDEACEVILHGTGEFFAENVTLGGNLRIEVPDGYRITARSNGEFIKEKISTPLLVWRYELQEDDQIVLSKT